MKQVLLFAVILSIVLALSSCAGEPTSTKANTHPTVSIAASKTTITNDDVGPNRFIVTATFSEVMDPSVIPIVTFSPALTKTLTNPKGAWNVGHTVYTWTFDIEYAAAKVDNIDVTVDGAKDLDGNIQVAYTVFDCINVNITEVVTTKQNTLRTLANALGKDFGTAIMPMGMNNTLYLNTASQQFNLILPDYGMYMVNTQPQQGVWTFSDMDRIVNYAVANKLKVRGHALVYGYNNQTIGTIGKDWTPTPAWVHNGNFSREEMIKIMYDHMTTVMRRYGNQVDEWIVVNESASWETGGGFADNIWKAGIGEDYVELAFEKAKELAPNAILILNEYGSDYIGQTNYGREDNIYNHVKNLVQRGVPIDAIGLEFHLTVPTEPWETEPTLDKILANFDRYGKLGLDVYVTELDVKIKEPITQEKLDTQAKIYAMVMEAVLLSDACKSISVWGYSDAYSWITTFNTFPGYTDGCMFDSSISPKSAYDAVIEALKKYQK